MRALGVGGAREFNSGERGTYVDAVKERDWNPVSPLGVPDPSYVEEPFWNWEVYIELKFPKDDMVLGRRLELFRTLLDVNQDLVLAQVGTNEHRLILTARIAGVDENDVKLDVWQIFMLAYNEVWPEYNKMTKSWVVKALTRTGVA